MMGLLSDAMAVFLVFRFMIAFFLLTGKAVALL